MLSPPLTAPRRIPLGRAIALVAVAALAVPATAAAGTLDQSQTDVSSLLIPIGGPDEPNGRTSSPAQKFTAGASGSLDKVDVHLRDPQGSSTADVTLEMRNVVAGVPGTTVLASETIPGASITDTGEWVEVPLSSPMSVTTGSTYAIVAYTSGADLYTWGISEDTDPYANGAAYRSPSSPPSTSWSPIPSRDFAFKTYVAENTAPVAVDDAYSHAGSDTPLVVAAPGVLGNDTDADSDPLTAVLVSGPTNGTLVLNADGSFTYQPNEGYIGPDSFTYKANDGTSDSNVATVALTIGAGCGGLPATIVGTSGDDVIEGTSGDDVIDGLGGDDEIAGGAGDDVICGGAGDDHLAGSAGDDHLAGGSGDDHLAGAAGNDTLLGGEGVDRLSGAAGDDHLDGGAGAPDVCLTASGDDTTTAACEVVRGPR